MISILTIIGLPICFLVSVIFDSTYPVNLISNICITVIAMADVIWMLIHFNDQPDPEFKERFGKTGWMRAIHKDILTSDTTEEDWHKERGDEDWHGL